MQVRESRAEKHNRGRGSKVFRVKRRQDRANIMQDKRTALVKKKKKRAGKNQNGGSGTDRATVSHAPPCETVASRGQGAALYKCLLAACGPAGAPHMFVLWSSHTDADGFAGPRRPSWSRSCLLVASAWLPSTSRIINPPPPRCSMAILSPQWGGSGRGGERRRGWTDQRCRLGVPADVAEPRTGPKQKH